MTHETKLSGLSIALTGLLWLSGAAIEAKGQDPTTQSDQPQTQTSQTTQVPNLGPLNLTQEQIKQIRTINAETKDQRQAAGRKLIQAQRSLAEAIEAPSRDEALITRRSHDVAEAREAMIRLRATSEARIIHDVLTPEQRVKVKEIRERQSLGRRDNQQLRRDGLGRRQGALPRNANTAAPLGPRQRRAVKPPQKPE